MAGSDGGPGRALITGGAGFLGHHLAARLLADGWEVRVLDVTASRHEAVDAVVGDVTDQALVERAVAGVRTVFHLAALLPQRRRPHDEMRAVNVDGTRNVLDAAGAAGARAVVQLSSVEVYGVPQQIPCPEDAPFRPIGEYGRNKVEAEELGRKAAADGLHVAMLRPCTIVGPGMPEPLLVAMVASAHKGKPLVVIGRGSTRFQLVSVHDVVEACLLALATPEASGQAFNLGSLDVPTMRETAERARARLGSRSRILSLPTWFVVGAVKALGAVGRAPLEPEHLAIALHDYVFDVARAERVLRWRPTRGNVEALLDVAAR